MSLDKELLLSIFHIASMSYNEDEMASFIKNFLEKYSIPYEEDKAGNIFSFKPGLPLLSAHMDTVQDIDDAELAGLIDIYRNNVLSGYGVIGGDDKCGIYIILEILREKKYDVNFAFTVQEEVGLKGSEALCLTRSEDLKKCSYGIILDRKGSGDIICYSNDYGTHKFDTALEEIGEKFSYKSTRGVLSDADEFNEYMSCANLSVGYYGAHTKQEFVVLSQLENAMDFVKEILANIKETFDAPTVSYYTGRRSRKTTSLVDGYNWNSWDYDMDDIDSYGYNSYLTKSCGICHSVEKTTFVPTLKKYVCDTCLKELAKDIMFLSEDFIFDLLEMQ